MRVEKIQNPDHVLSCLMKSKKREILISDVDGEKIIEEINGVLGYAQTCYRGKMITIPKITKAKRNINKHIDELLCYLDVGSSSSVDPSILAFQQAISFSEEDVTYFGQQSCSLIQLKKELETFYTYKENPSGSGPKNDEFNEVIRFLLKIYKRYHDSFEISGRGPSTYLKKGKLRVSEDKLITGNLVDFILSVCSPLTFHGRDEKQLKHMIKNCL